MIGKIKTLFLNQPKNILVIDFEIDDLHRTFLFRIKLAVVNLHDQGKHFIIGTAEYSGIGSLKPGEFYFFAEFTFYVCGNQVCLLQ